MTHSTLMTLSSRALQLAALFLAATPVAFGGEPVASDRDGQLMGHMVVTAEREVPLIGSMVVTAPRSMVVLVADLGGMTVTAERETDRVAHLGEMTVTADRQPTQVADLGAMTVTAARQTVVARRDAPPAAERLSISISLITVPLVETRGVRL